MNTRELIEELVDIDVEDGIVRVQALDPTTGAWYWVTGVERATYSDPEGKSVVAVLKIEKVG